MSNFIIIKREALQNAIDELEDFTIQLKSYYGDCADPEDIITQLKEIRKRI